MSRRRRHGAGGRWKRLGGRRTEVGGRRPEGGTRSASAFPPLTHSPTHPLTHSPTHPFTHSPIHPFTHSPTHPFTLRPTRPPPPSAHPSRIPERAPPLSFCIFHFSLFIFHSPPSALRASRLPLPPCKINPVMRKIAAHRLRAAQTHRQVTIPISAFVRFSVLVSSSPCLTLPIHPLKTTRNPLRARTAKTATRRRR